MNLYSDIPSSMKGKTLMITGGTGSFGSTVLNRFLQTDIGEIRVFSRDEKKLNIPPMFVHAQSVRNPCTVLTECTHKTRGLSALDGRNIQQNLAENDRYSVAVFDRC